MSSNTEDNLSRIREIIGTDAFDERLPDLAKEVHVVLLRCERLETRVLALENDRSRLNDEVSKLKHQVYEDLGFFERVSRRLKK